MTDSMPSKSMSVSRIATYLGVAAVSSLATSFFVTSGVVRTAMAIAGILIGAGAVYVLYRLVDIEKNSPIAAERFAAALALGVVSATIVAINLTRLVAPKAASNVVDTTTDTENMPTADVSAVQSDGQALDIVSEKPVKKTTGDSHRQPAPVGPQMPPELAKEVDGMLMRADRLTKDGKLDEAESLLLQVLEMMDTHAPRDLPQRGQVVGALARLRFAAEKKGDGIDVIDQHIARLEDSGTADPMIVASFHELAGALLGNSGEFEASIDRFRQVYEIQTRINADPAAIAGTHAKLAISYAKVDDKSQAKQELDRARELLRTATPRNPEALGRLDQIAKEYNL